MHIVYFLTYDYSFKIWNESGNLSRELNYFNKFSDLDPSICYTFISYGDNDDLEYLNESNQIRLIPIYEHVPRFENKLLRFVVSLYIPFVLKKILKFESIDIIKQNQLQGSWVALIFKLITKKPLITRTGYDVLTFKKKERKSKFIVLFYKLLTKVCLRQSSIYTVTSNVDKQFLKKKFKKYKKIKLRRNFVNLENLKQFNEFETRRSTIVCSGRLEEQKNFFYILNELKDNKIDLEIYGDGSKREELEVFSKNNKNKVSFMGQVDNKRILEVLSNNKYFISASIYEGNPKNVLEAMLCGCIVFVSKNDNTSEIITNGKDGFLYDLGEGNLEHSFKINYLNEDLLKNISLNAKARVETNNSLEKLVELEISDFKEVIQ